MHFVRRMWLAEALLELSLILGLCLLADYVLSRLLVVLRRPDSQAIVHLVGQVCNRDNIVISSFYSRSWMLLATFGHMVWFV